MSGFNMATFEHWMAKKMSFGLDARLRFYRRMEKFIERGNPLKTAIDGMLRRYERPKGLLKRQHPLRHIFRRIQRAVSTEGQSFVRAFGEYGSPVETMMIAAGFAGDKAAEGFRMAGYVASSTRTMRRAVSREMAWPITLILIGLVMLVMLSRQFVPIMLQINPDVESWPALSQMLAGTSHAITHYGFYILAGIIAICWAIAFSLPRWRGPVRVRFMDRFIPPWSMYRVFQAASFLIGLGSMVRTGTPVASALNGLMAPAAPWMRAHLTLMMTRIRSGDATFVALDTGLLDEETMGDLEDYAAAGAIDEALIIMGEDAIEGAISRITVISKVMSVFALLFVAGIIVVVYGGFMAFMYTLTSALDSSIP